MDTLKVVPYTAYKLSRDGLVRDTEFQSEARRPENGTY
jgi:hypothetical protein